MCIILFAKCKDKKRGRKLPVQNCEMSGKKCHLFSTCIYINAGNLTWLNNMVAFQLSAIRKASYKPVEIAR